jgi:hypothetical protein
VLNNLVWDEVAQYEKEKQMPFMTTPERLAKEKYLLRGIEVSLAVKFGAEGLKLLPEIRQIEDHEVLEAVLDAIITAATPDDLRRVWTRSE